MAVSNRPWGDISDADYPDPGALCARTPLQAPAAQRRAAARRLIRLYGELDEEPPESLRRLAGQ